MPCDMNNDINLIEYETILSEISMLCIKHNEENICIAGDINMEITRTHSWHT